MENIIVTGAVIAFLLMILPAVIVPFLNQNPSVLDTAAHIEPDPIGPRTPVTGGTQHPTDRIAA